MNIDEAVQKHAEWKRTFGSAIAHKEHLDAATIGRDDCCSVGKWLYGDGASELGGSPEFREVVEKHRTFHVEAGKIARLINEAKYSDAEAGLVSGSPYSNASDQVGAALMALKRNARN